MERIDKAQAGFRSLTEAIDTTSAAGRNKKLTANRSFWIPSYLRSNDGVASMKRRETLAELVARTVVEFEQRELQNTQVYCVQPQEKSTKQRKSKKVA